MIILEIKKYSNLFNNIKLVFLQLKQNLQYHLSLGYWQYKVLSIYY